MSDDANAPYGAPDPDAIPTAHVEAVTAEVRRVHGALAKMVEHLAAAQKSLDTALTMNGPIWHGIEAVYRLAYEQGYADGAAQPDGDESASARSDS